MQTRTKESRKRLQSLILLTAFTCVLLIVSTYAWFTVQKDVNVSNIRARVEVAEGLQISLDALNWTQVLDLGSEQEPATADTKASLVTPTGADAASYKYIPYANHRNHVPEELLPVSTSGEELALVGSKTDDNAGTELGMFVGKYEGNDSKKLSTVERADETSTTVSDNDYAGYFAFDIFLKNSSKTGVDKDVLQLNSDSSAWVLPAGDGITVNRSGTDVVYNGNDASGLQNTIRIAFARYGAGETVLPLNTTTQLYANNVVSADAPQTIALPKTTQAIDAVSIWEPNHDTHTTTIQSNIGPYFGGSLPADPFFTKTLKEGITTLNNVFDWGTGSPLGQPMTVQTTSYAADPGVIDEGVTNLTDIDGNDFTLAANSITRLRVYVYLEGQDPDCDNSASRGGGIEVNLGLTKGESEGTFDRYNEVNGANRGSGS